MNVKPHGTLGIDEKGHWQCKTHRLISNYRKEWNGMAFFVSIKMTKMVLLLFPTISEEGVIKLE